MNKNRIIEGDCIEVLRTMPDNSVDSVVTDPPYGLSKEPDIREVLTKWMAGEDYEHRGGGFMGKSWDSFVPGPSVWREVYRVLKPGAHALVFAGTRTQDLMTISLRLAGFEVRDVIEWLYFSGFPKSRNISKDLDRRAGAVREVIGEIKAPGLAKSNVEQGTQVRSVYKFKQVSDVPISDSAKKWAGWGTALKPAHEPIIVVRKPLEGTVADNIERYGTGAINIDGCRIGSDEITTHGGGGVTGTAYNWTKTDRRYVGSNRNGRFPANCITLDDDQFYSKYFNITPPELSKKASKKDRNSDWRGEEITLEPKETDSSHFYGGLPDLRMKSKQKRLPNANNHPTVKPTDLMAWLVRLVTPAGGTVLDPFAGSGSTLVAAKREGFGFIGIEREAEYIEIAKARIGEKEEIILTT